MIQQEDYSASAIECALIISPSLIYQRLLAAFKLWAGKDATPVE